MKRGTFIWLFVIIALVAMGGSLAWGSWQYVESEAETTTASTSFVTKVQEVANSSGYHLILASFEVGINDTAAFALSRVMRNSTVMGDYTLQTFDSSNRYRTFALHSIINLTAGDTIKITFATNASGPSQINTRIRRARIVLIPLTGMEYNTGTGLNTLNLNTNWSNEATVNVTPTLPGDYLVMASLELRPNSTIYSGESRVELDGTSTWDLFTMEGKNASDKAPYFSARVVNLSASAHTLRLQARSDEDAATDVYNPRISVIRLTQKINNFSQGEQLGIDSTTNGGDSWVNRLTHVHHPFQPGSYLVLGSSFVKSIPDTSVVPEQRWTLNGQEENKFLDVLKDSTDFLQQVGFRVFNWSVAPETLKVDFTKNSSGSAPVYIKDARVITISEQLYTGFPVLDSIGPKSLVEGDTLKFRIRASDPEGDSIILSAVNAPLHAALFDSGNGAGSFVFTPAFNQAGVYNVTFIARDTTAKADSEVVAITVTEFGNHAPVLDSIRAKTVLEGDTLRFRIHATDLDLDSIVLSALHVPSNAVFVDSGHGSGSFVFTPSFAQSGIYYVTFKVTDPLSAVDSEVVQITVNNVIRAPALDSIGPQNVNEGVNLSFRIHATDPDGDSVILHATNLPVNATFVDSGHGAGSFIFNPDFTQAGVYHVTFTASDTFLAKDSEVVAITVNNVNRAPVLDSIGPKNLVEGDTLRFRIHATDLDLDSIVLSALHVPSNAVFVDSGHGSGSFAFTPSFAQSGIYNVTFKATDTLGGVDSEVVQVTVTEFGNHAPVLDSIRAKTVLEGDTLRFRIHATDLDLDSIILTALHVPSNAVFVDSGHGSGSFVFTPSFAQSGIYYVTFKVTDLLSAVDSEVVQITVNNVIRAPALDSIGPKNVNEGVSLSFRIHATDPDGDSVILHAANLPVNATFVDSGHGAGSFIFDPDYTQAGVYYVTFTASDTFLATDSEVVVITVNNVNRAPVLDSIGPKTVLEGDTLRFSTHAADLDGDSIILRALHVPSHAVFVDSGHGSGSFVFTPSFTQSGIYNVTFKATDTLGGVDSEVVAITVTEFGNHAPVLDSIGPKTVLEGDTLRFGIHATDLDLDSIVLSALHVPSHAVFVDSGHGSGSFVFTPSFAQSGIYNVTFKATDPLGGVDSEVVQITVTEFGNHAPVLDSIGPKSLAEGDTLRFRIHATDLDLDSIILTALNVPTNAVFVDSGHGSGSLVFTPSFAQSGIYNVTFKAADTPGAVDSEVVRITVNNVIRAPVLDSIGPKNVDEGGSLSFRIHATDPDGDSIILHAGNVPNHASFVDSGNGAGSFVFNPAHNQAGVYHITFTAADTFSAKDSEVVAIKVNSLNHAPTLDSIGPKTVGERDTLRFRVHASDVDMDSLRLSAYNRPARAFFVDSGNGAGLFSFMPDTTQAGTYYVTFVAADTALADSERVQITVTNWANRPPVLDSIGPKTIPEGGNLIFTVIAHDSDGTIPILSVSNLPTHATFVDSGNGHGLFRFYPDFYQAGVETVTFAAIDMAYPPPLSDFEKVVITIVDVNQPPFIDSIGPKTVQSGHTLNIRVVGHDLTDPDGGPLHMSAAHLPLNSAFHDSGGGVGGFTFSPDYSQVGVDTVTFFCTDEGTPPLSGYRMVEITVTQGADRPPVLDSIGYKSVREGDTLRFRVHASDPDGTTPMLYTSHPLPQNASFVDSGNGAGSFLFTPSYVQSGLYQIRFYASDGQLQDYEDVLVQVVEAGNQAPILDSIGPKSLTEGDSLKLRIHATDPEGNPITLSLKNNPPNSSLADSGNGSGLFLFHPSYVQSGIYTMTFTAADSLGKADSELVQITVIEAGNQAPILDSIGPKSVTERLWLIFTVTAHDPDLNTPYLRASNLPPSASFTDNHNGTASFTYRPTYFEQGVYNTLFEAIDSVDTLLRDWELVQITVVDSNQKPVGRIWPDSTRTNVKEGQTCWFKVIGTDPDSTIPIPHVTPIPNNATFVDSGNGVGLFTFTPGYNQGQPSGSHEPKAYPETVFVVDQVYPADTGWVAKPYNIYVWDVPEPPNIVPINDTSIMEGITLDIHVVTTSTVDMPTLQAIRRPWNSSFVDSGNGRGAFRFTPEYTQGDSIYLVRFISQSRGLADTEDVSIHVIETGNHAPVLDSIGPKTVGEEQVLSFRIHAIDVDHDPITLSTGNVPTNAAFVDSGNGAGSFVFHPNWSQAGVYYVTFIARDNHSAQDSEVVQITVQDVNQPPVLDSIGPKTVPEGQTLRFRVHATDVEHDSLVLSAGPLPRNASFFDSGNGAGVFTFSPDYVQTGVYTVMFTVSDLGSSDMETVPITVTNVDRPPVLDSIKAKVVMEGDSLKFRIHAADPDGDTIKLSVINNPPNSSLFDSGNGSGVFRFKPSFVQAGIYWLIFKATDNFGEADSELVRITVNEAGNQPPVLTPLPDSVEPATGDSFKLHIYATDPDGPNIHLSAAGSPPHSALVDSGNGGGLFRFLPDSTQENSIYHVIFIASDGSLADSEMVAMRVISYVPGDANGDRNVDVGDVVYLLNYLFREGSPPLRPSAGDPNADCVINVGDVIYLLNYLYRDGPPPNHGCVSRK